MRTRNMPVWIVILMVSGFLITGAGIAAADDAPAAETLEAAGRAVVEASGNAYESSREFVIDAGQAIAAGAREAVEEAGDLGPRIVEEVRDDLRGGGQAPDPTADRRLPAEKP